MSYGAALKYDAWSGNTGTARFAQSVADRIPVAPVSREPSWVGPTTDKINDLASLREDNWDGRGSAAVRMDVLAFAWSILSQVMPFDGRAPGIIPLGHGGIQIEWRGKNGRELELEIVRPHEIEGTLFDTQNDSEYEFRANAVDLGELTTLVWQYIPRP